MALTPFGFNGIIFRDLNQLRLAIPATSLPVVLPDPQVTTQSVEGLPLASVQAELESRSIQVDPEALQALSLASSLTEVVKEYYIRGQDSSLTWVQLRSVTGAPGQGILIAFHSVLVTMTLPPLVTHVRVSKKSGSRRYGLAGPRKKKHSTVCVPRGVTPAEAARILQHLEASVASYRNDMHLK